MPHEFAVDLMIIGAQKAATTSLLGYLGQHPSVLAHASREMGFFVNDDEWQAGWPLAFERYYGPVAQGRAVVGKSVRMLYEGISLRRLRQHNPEIEIVVSLRDPVDRAFSAYWMSRRRGVEGAATFEEAIGYQTTNDRGLALESLGGPYIEQGLYAKYLRGVLDVFDRGHLRLIRFEDIRDRPAEVCSRLFALLPGVDASFRPDFNLVANPVAVPRVRPLARLLSDRTYFTGLKSMVRRALRASRMDWLRDRLRQWNDRAIARPSMTPATERFLREFYRPHNEELAAFTGLDLTAWTGSA
jgi:hypothetical protein